MPTDVLWRMSVTAVNWFSLRRCWRTCCEECQWRRSTGPVWDETDGRAVKDVSDGGQLVQSETRLTDVLWRMSVTAVNWPSLRRCRRTCCEGCQWRRSIGPVWDEADRRVVKDVSDGGQLAQSETRLTDVLWRMSVTAVNWPSLRRGWRTCCEGCQWRRSTGPVWDETDGRAVKDVSDGGQLVQSETRLTDVLWRMSVMAVNWPSLRRCRRTCCEGCRWRRSTGPVWDETDGRAVKDVSDGGQLVQSETRLTDVLWRMSVTAVNWPSLRRGWQTCCEGCQWWRSTGPVWDETDGRAVKDVSDGGQLAQSETRLTDVLWRMSVTAVNWPSLRRGWRTCCEGCQWRRSTGPVWDDADGRVVKDVGDGGQLAQSETRLTDVLWRMSVMAVNWPSLRRGWRTCCEGCQWRRSTGPVWDEADGRAVKDVSDGGQLAQSETRLTDVLWRMSVTAVNWPSLRRGWRTCCEGCQWRRSIGPVWDEADRRVVKDVSDGGQLAQSETRLTDVLWRMSVTAVN